MKKVKNAKIVIALLVGIVLMSGTCKKKDRCPGVGAIPTAEKAASKA